jgi:hypothetical protein
MFLPVWVEYLDPVLGGYAVYVFILDPLGLGLPFWPYPLLRWLGVPLLVAAVLCVRRRTLWTWVPVVLWILWWTYAFHERQLYELTEVDDPRTGPLPWPWLAALIGAACLLLASRRATPDTDLCTFD